MKTRVRFIALFLPLLLGLAGGGCMTSGLWQNDDMETLKKPADKPNVRVFQDPSQPNFLVLYDEYSERKHSVRTRAYWLNENQGRTDDHVRPRFATTAAIDHLPSIPVFYDPIPTGTNLPAQPCVVVATNKLSFTLYRDQRAIRSYALPIYNDGRGREEKIALTPLTVAGDATIVGTVIAGAIAYWYTSSNDVQNRVNNGEYVPIWPP